jgi:hypothetical protein
MIVHSTRFSTLPITRGAAVCKQFVQLVYKHYGQMQTIALLVSLKTRSDLHGKIRNKCQLIRSTTF